MKALIAKLYLAAKQFFFFLGRERWCVLTIDVKILSVHCTTVFSSVIQCCELRQFWKGSADQNVVSRAFYIAKQSSKYWQNKRSSNCLTEFSLRANYDSFTPLSFIHFGIPHNLKSSLQETGEISCVIEILFSLIYSRMVLMIVCWRYWMPFDANGRRSTLTNITFYAKILIESDKSVNECRLDKMNVFFVLTSLRLTLITIYFVVMTSKRCTITLIFQSFHVWCQTKCFQNSQFCQLTSHPLIPLK